MKSTTTTTICWLSKNNKAILCIMILCICLSQCIFSQYVAPPYAAWAHDHLVWNNNKEIQQDVVNTLNGYIERQIPVGAFNIDSSWSTCFNDFNWNRTKFPNPQELIDWLHEKEAKVLLWATSVVNANCDNYQEGKDKGYFLNNGKTFHWWHGDGSFVDFFNPEATAWWKKQMDKVLDMGIDGWKCDGTDPMVVLLRPWPYSPHAKKLVVPHQYSEKYYGTFYNYTLEKNPSSLIMARPIDSYHGLGYLKYAPKYVMFAGWVGDQDSDAEGLKLAMKNVIHSAWAGYLNFGFDIGGYRGEKKDRHIMTKSIFLRWVQAGAFVPFMENGGMGRHTPWSFDEETVKIYKKFVLIHYELKDYLLDAGTEAYAQGVSVIEPLSRKQGSITLFTEPDTYCYMLGKSLLVCPIFSESSITEVIFPKGTWVYYFNQKKYHFKGPSSITRSFKLDEFPVFKKTESIIPINRNYQNLKYMTEHRQMEGKPLKPIEELELVYLKEGITKEIIYKADYTDYLSIDVNDEKKEMLIKLERFCKEKGLEATEAKAHVVKDIRVRLIGGIYEKDINIIRTSLKIMKNGIVNKNENENENEIKEKEEAEVEKEIDEKEMKIISNNSNNQFVDESIKNSNNEEFILDIQPGYEYKIEGISFDRSFETTIKTTTNQNEEEEQQIQTKQE